MSYHSELHAQMVAMKRENRRTDWSKEEFGYSRRFKPTITDDTPLAAVQLDGEIVKVHGRAELDAVIECGGSVLRYYRSL